jgi:DNA-binding LytR/AlgR family response regulator
MASILEIVTSKGNKLIDINNIKFIKAAKKNSIIYLNDQSSIQAKHMLKWYIKHLPVPEFYRCHRNIIVNCTFVEFYYSCTIILQGDIRLPLSRIKRYFFIKLRTSNLDCLPDWMLQMLTE